MVIDFKRLVRRYSWSSELLKNTELFEELIESNTSTVEDSKNLIADLKYLLHKVSEWSDLHNLCNNEPLLKYALREFLFDRQLVDKFNRILKKSRFKYENIHDMFDWIEFETTHYYNEDYVEEECEQWEELGDMQIDEEIMKLNDLNRVLYSFKLTRDQKLEVTELVQNNEVALNRLKEIIENHLESNYDFDSLMNYLKKSEKKSILNI